MLKLFGADLHMFDAGAEGSVGEGSIAAPQSQSAVNVQNDPTAGGDQGNVATKSAEQLEKEYRELIKGEYKDIHTKEFQKMLNRRLANTHKLNEQLESQNRLISLISSKYGESDIGKLSEMIEADNHMLEQEAYEKNIPVETLAELKSLKREADMERMARETLERQNKERQQYSQWLREAEAIKEQYPDFDLNAEVENPQFTAMLQSGVDLKHAYEVIHMNDIVANTAKNVMNTSAKAVTDTIAARGMRPKENAGSDNSSAVYKRDVSSLTAKDREEIARKVARGEKISF
jgi:hypothetical protein